MPQDVLAMPWLTAIQFAFSTLQFRMLPSRAPESCEGKQVAKSPCPQRF